MAGILELVNACQTDWIWLDVVKSNTSAQRFYQRHGFCLLGEMPLRTDLQEVGLFVMGRPLSGG